MIPGISGARAEWSEPSHVRGVKAGWSEPSQGNGVKAGWSEPSHVSGVKQDRVNQLRYKWRLSRME